MKRWVTQNRDAFSDDEILKLEIFFDKTIDENDEIEEQSKSFTKKFPVQWRKPPHARWNKSKQYGW